MFFSSAHGMFRSHVRPQNKYYKLKTEIIPSIFFVHSGIKLEINYKKKKRKKTNVEDKYYTTKQLMASEGSKDGIKK